MPRGIKRFFGNLTLSALSLALCLFVLEFGVFAHWLVPDDVIRNVSSNGVVRYEPNTHARFHNPDGSVFRVNINADGWNSTKSRYAVEKTPGTLRIAVIGDSYVQAATVNVDENFAEVMERRLKAQGIDADVYRFGMDGAPLSQYLHMLRREVVRYRPDIVLVPLIHNDFDESYRLISTRYASSFLKIVPDGKGKFTEVAPADFTPGLADRLRDLRTFRYVYYETGLYKGIGATMKSLWWGGEAHARAAEYVSSGVDIRNIGDHDTIRAVTRYILKQMQALSREKGFRLVFAMDGVREAVYSGRPRSRYAVAALNEMAADLTRELKLPFLDLQNTFADDFRHKKQRFEYDWDWHWNAYANRLVGETLAAFIASNRPAAGKRSNR